MSTTLAKRLDWTAIEARCLQLGADTRQAQAALLGLDRTTLWRWIRGDVHSTSLDKITDIALRLGLDLDDILLAKPKPPSPPPPPPKPPAGPGDSRPPAGPKRGEDR